MTRILIVVRDRRLGLVLERAFGAQGHSVCLVADLRVASARVDYEGFDSVIVDGGLKGDDGFDLLRESCTGSGAPRLMMLDARPEDDTATLLSRARALLGVRAGDHEPKLAAGDIGLDPWKRRARAGGAEVALTDREFSLLRIFLRHPGRVLSREELHLHAWGHELPASSNAVEVYVGYLRRKLGADVIHTVRGRGYVLAREARGGPRRL